MLLKEWAYFSIHRDSNALYACYFTYLQRKSYISELAQAMESPMRNIAVASMILVLFIPV